MGMVEEVVYDDVYVYDVQVVYVLVQVEQEWDQALEQVWDQALDREEINWVVLLNMLPVYLV